MDKFEDQLVFSLTSLQKTSSSLGMAPVTLVMRFSSLLQKLKYSKMGFIQPLMMQYAELNYPWWWAWCLSWLIISPAFCRNWMMG